MTKITLTPKDCLYIEDLVNATTLLYKKTKKEMEMVENKTYQKHLEKICTQLKGQAESLVSIMEGASA